MINNRNISESNPKHYYAESERIASKIGGGKLYDLHSIVHDEQVSKKISYNAQLLYHVMECTGSKAKIEDLNLLKILTHLHDSLAPEKHLFWYHPDHLGSSSWITYTDGEAIQHLHYLPFGESFVDQRISSFSARYTFSAKEKDVETSYGYFGARYYSSDLSIWLSVDPMSDKYPSMSAYVYCANNPVKLVDPNGREIIGTDGKSVTYSYDQNGNVIWSNNATKDTKRIGNAMLKTETGKEQFDKLCESKTKFTLNIQDRTEDKDIMGSMMYKSSDFQENSDGTIDLKAANIVIYEGAIRDYLASGDFGHSALGMGTDWASKDGETGIENYIAAVAGHEAEHGTSQENLKLISIAQMYHTQDNIFNRELGPDCIKTSILWDSYLKIK